VIGRALGVQNDRREGSEGAERSGIHDTSDARTIDNSLTAGA
jgi:hypothetical protein